MKHHSYEIGKPYEKIDPVQWQAYGDFKGPRMNLRERWKGQSPTQVPRGVSCPHGVFTYGAVSSSRTRVNTETVRPGYPKVDVRGWAGLYPRPSGGHLNTPLGSFSDGTRKQRRKSAIMHTLLLIDGVAFLTTLSIGHLRSDHKARSSDHTSKNVSSDSSELEYNILIWYSFHYSTLTEFHK